MYVYIYVHVNIKQRSKPFSDENKLYWKKMKRKTEPCIWELICETKQISLEVHP